MTWENDYLSFFFFFGVEDYFITTNKSSQIMNMSDVRDTTTQGSRLSRKPLKKKNNLIQ